MSPVTRKDPKARGNRAADAAAQEVASRDYAAPILAVGLPPPGMGALPPVPEYSLPDLAWINEDTTLQKDDKDGWYRDQNNNLILPATLGRHLCEHLNTTTHLGGKKTLTLLQTACLRFPRQNATAREIIQACKVVPADEDREKAALGNEVLRGRARATLGDRFH